MTSWEERRATEWTPHDPNRACYGCGEPPVGTFGDGSPRYRPHSHPVSVATPEEAARYVAQRPLVVLTEAESVRARRHAEAVEKNARQEGYRDKFRPKSIEEAVRGYSGEIAVARALGLPWNPRIYHGPVRRKEADVGKNVEVRTWAGRGLYCPVRDGDPVDRVVVLVVGLSVYWELVGWTVAGRVMIPEFRYDDRHKSPYWRVPVRALELFPIPAHLAR